MAPSGGNGNKQLVLAIHHGGVRHGVWRRRVPLLRLEDAGVGIVEEVAPHQEGLRGDESTAFPESTSPDQGLTATKSHHGWRGFTRDTLCRQPGGHCLPPVLDLR